MGVLPNLAHGSTTFNNRITSYDLLSLRIKRMLGYPLIQIEISDEQVYEIIDTACEYFTKFSGVTEEFLIFKSDLYVKGSGLPVGRLMNITPDMASSPNPDRTSFPLSYQNNEAIDPEEYVTNIGNGTDKLFIINHNLNDENVVVQLWDNNSKQQVFSTIKIESANSVSVSFNVAISTNKIKVVIYKDNEADKFSVVIGDGSSKVYTIDHNLNDDDLMVQVVDNNTQQLISTTTKFLTNNSVEISFLSTPALSGYTVNIFTGDNYNPLFRLTNSAGWDFDLNNYRRVVDVYSFAEGNNSGVNTLFTIEHTIAQQAYFGHLLGNVGYDLVTWQALKGWLDLREKVLALQPYLRFDPHTQMLKIIPEPSANPPYYGLIGCKVQKPIKDIVSQLWVYRYSLALAKITIAHTRGKYGGTNLFGGQSVSYSDLMSQGVAEKEKLEAEITSDLIDRDPIRFFIG
jgi:hypothetical protein